MRIEFAALALAIAMLSPATAQAACSIDQRIELAKAGYNNEEIDALCAEGASAPEAARAMTPDEVLAAATYDAVETPPFNRIYSAREKCEFLSDSVKVNNNKKTFGGYYSKVIPYGRFSNYKNARQVHADKEKGVFNASLKITAFGIDVANETCFAVLWFRKDVAPEDFDSLTARAEAELDAVTQALNAKGAKIE